MARRTLVIVLNYNGESVIRPCLDSLEELRQDPHVRVLVADNASPDDSLDIVREEYPWVEAVQNGENLGFAKGNNAILARYEADDYVLLNNDTEAHPGWLDALQAEAASDPAIGVVGAKLLFPDGRIQHAGGTVDARGPRHLGYLGAAEAYDVPADVDYVTFAAVLIQREVIERIGYLDEGYAPMYYEDADYCLRARAAGFRVRYTPQSVLVHHESVAVRRTPSRDRLLIEERSRLRLKLIHFPLRWWVSALDYELKKWAGNLRDGNADVLARAWRDNLDAEVRARRRNPAAFVPSAFGGADGRHAPVIPWNRSDRP